MPRRTLPVAAALNRTIAAAEFDGPTRPYPFGAAFSAFSATALAYSSAL